MSASLRLSAGAVTSACVCTGLALASLALAACPAKSTQSQREAAGTEAIERVAQADNPWFAAGERAVSSLANQPRHPDGARNIILFVGDGMSLATITAARIYAGQRAGGDGEEHNLVFETLPHTALMKTYTTDMQVPDSAGTATAMLSGIKTRTGYLGVSAQAELGRCDAATRAESLLETAARRGKATGVVSTARITHATPAATYAHVPQRDYEHDGNLPQDVAHGCVDIARQLVEFDVGDGIAVVLGGGRRAFLPATLSDPEKPNLSGARRDGRHLAKEWKARRGDNAHVVYRGSELDALDPAKIDRVLGLFEPSHMMYEADRVAKAADEPSLAQMTEFAIRRLERDREGYFLLVEGGRIDHAHHAGNAARALADTVALDDAVARALSLVDLSETMIVVTADHGHVMSMSGYPRRGNPILGKVMQIGFLSPDGPALARDQNRLPYTTLNYANGPGHRPTRPDLTDVDTRDINYRQEATVPLRSETHSGTDVIVYAAGAGAHLFRGTHEQNVVYHVMRRAFDVHASASLR